MPKSNVVKVGPEHPVSARNEAETTGSWGDCIICGKQQRLVSRGRCDACRKRGERENLEQTAKRRILNERSEREKLMKIYHHFQTGYLQLGLSDEQIATELLGLLSRCAAQFEPVLPLLNPAGQRKGGNGHGHKPKASVSNLSTPVVISAAANGNANGAATESKPSTLTATLNPESVETPDGTGTETTEEPMEVLVEAAPQTLVAA